MTTPTKFFIIFATVFAINITSASAFDVVLKNGKVLQGTLINETADNYVLKDAGGLQLKIKKSSVDLVKTEEANAKPTEPVPSAASDSDTKAVVADDAAEKPKTVEKKKPARVFSQKDLQQLREKYPMESGTGVTIKGDPHSTESQSQRQSEGERTEQEWRSMAQSLAARLASAKEAHEQLQQNCQRLKGITIQSHILVDKNSGETLDMQETSKEVCSEAEEASELYEQAKQDYRNFVEEARQQSVPPGYLRSADGSDPVVE